MRGVLYFYKRGPRLHMSERPGEITALLGKIRAGDKGAEAKLLELVYRELHSIARRHMRGERKNHTLAPTALVHETYLRLAEDHMPDFQSRTHFFAVAAATMRRVLVDHARANGCVKRGGSNQRVELDGLLAAKSIPLSNVLAVSEALDRLSEFDRRQSAIVELRFFGGLTDEEVAAVLSVSSRTVKREWAVAKAWLYSQLK